MTASAAGTVEAPGRNVRAKAGLNRTVLRNGWGVARSMLEYKTAWRGGVLVAVPPAYTSQTCSACGHTAAHNRPSQAQLACVACGHREHADRNAAKNVLARAQHRLATADAIQPGGCPARTAGYAGTNACEGVAVSKDAPRRRPRSAAQGRPLGLPWAGTTSGRSLPGESPPIAACSA